MKQIFVAVTLYFFIVQGTDAQSDNGIHFEQGLSWTQVKEKAKSEHKYIFVDCFASWCGPCKAMDKDVYLDERVGKFMNQNFVSLKMQMDIASQDNDLIKMPYSDSHSIMQEYNVNVFPTFLFFTPKGEIVHREIGYKNVAGFIGISTNAMNPDKQYYSLLAKYNQGNLDTAYMKGLARTANTLGYKELAGKIADVYINRLPEDYLYTPDNIWFMIEFTSTSKDRGFSVFRNHADEIHKSVNEIDAENLKGILENIIYKEEIAPYVNSRNGGPDWSKMELNSKKYDSLGEEAYKTHKPGIVFTSAIEPALKKDPDWSKILPVIKKQHAGKGEEFLVGSSVVYYLNSGLVSGASNDCKNFMASATYYFQKYYSHLTADPLNTWAWTIFQRSADKKELSTALVWSDSCLKLSPKPDAGYFDTYANLLYKLGKSEDALNWEKKAIVLAPDDKAIQDNFSKMKNSERTW